MLRLPDDGMVDGLAASLLEDDGRLPLIGDADSGDLVHRDHVDHEQLVYAVDDRDPDALGVAFDPTRMGEKAFDLAGGPAQNPPLQIQKKGPSRGRPLIDGYHVISHRQMINRKPERKKARFGLKPIYGPS